MEWNEEWNGMGTIHYTYRDAQCLRVHRVSEWKRLRILIEDGIEDRSECLNELFLGED